VLASPNGPQFPEHAVAEGWAKIREDAGRKDDSDESTALVEKLQVVEARAKADSKGLWSESGGRINCFYDIPNVKQFVEEYKGKPIDGMTLYLNWQETLANFSLGLVEKVLSGDRLIMRLLLLPDKHAQVMLLLAGIRAPSTKRVNPSDGQEQAAEPFGDEAQQFVETRMLQRNASVDVLGVSPQGQIVATVKHPQMGTIAPYILKAGLARCSDFHSTLLGQEMGVLRQAEKEARDARRGVFQGHTTAKSAGSETEAVVSRVQSADTIFLRNNKTGVERRINLSSVRQPKPSDPKQAPFGVEAKEFLRKRLIGKHVKFHIDGKRAATEGYDEREMATVSQAGKNVALMLVENGYASVIRHRQDDPDRSPIYDDLLLAEQQAQEQKKGMWADKPPAAKNYVDYSESLEKAKRQATLLTRQKKVPAIVDFVKSGSRFTLLIPRDNAKLTLVLSGIRAPKAARNANDKSEPFGQDALDFANRRCLQRDVEIDVEDTDKVGGFIGTLHVNRENFAKLLLDEGLASVHAYSAEKSGHATELFAAEKKAKEARKGMWHDWDPSQDEDAEGPAPDHNDVNGSNKNSPEANGDAAQQQQQQQQQQQHQQQPRKQDYRDVIITHIDDSGRLKLQQIGSGTSQLQSLMDQFRSFHLSSNTSSKALDPAPKAGDYMAAKFSADGSWYRARVRRNDRENKRAEVLYIDYGNSEVLPWTDLRPLGKDSFGVAALKPQATDAMLSFCQLPGSPEYLDDAIAWLARETDGKQLVASVDFVDRDGGLCVTLFDAGRSERVEESLNAELVGEGLAMVPRKLKAWEVGRVGEQVLARLREREKEAKEERRGMWEYGDLTADDE
jgi:staphylococcal nuclease domain-containing protein 1